MRFPGTRRAAAAAACALALLFQSGAGDQSVQGGDRPHTIAGIFGVGGVLTADGTLWQYMPDRKKWLTIDEAFRGEGRETRILPLPVAAGDIQSMQSWGFLVTRRGEVWHYDLGSNRWENIGPPPAKN